MIDLTKVKWQQIFHPKSFVVVFLVSLFFTLVSCSNRMSHDNFISENGTHYKAQNANVQSSTQHQRVSQKMIQPPIRGVD